MKLKCSGVLKKCNNMSTCNIYLDEKRTGFFPFCSSCAKNYIAKHPYLQEFNKGKK